MLLLYETKRMNPTDTVFSERAGHECVLPGCVYLKSQLQANAAITTEIRIVVTLRALKPGCTGAF